MKIKRDNNEVDIPNWLLTLGLYVVSDVVVKVVETVKRGSNK